MITLLIFIVLCSNLIINSSPALGVSTIKVGGQLSLTSSPLVSPSRKFTLGFFTIRNTNRTYLGIWYTDDDQSRKVWVANPSTPITSSSSVLMIDPNTQNLIIDTEGTTLVNISDNQSGPTPNLTATLQDTGDFQLKNEVDNRILWKSFDYPTNTLLPGMKLGSDLRTGRHWKLTSWLTDEIPASGAFTMSWEPNGENSQRLMIRRRGQPYWTSGDLINNQRFEFMHVNKPNWIGFRYNISYVYNNEERYFTYNSFNGTVNPMWILAARGQVFNDKNFWMRYRDFCYGFDSDEGCVAVSNLPQCRSKDEYYFQLNVGFTPGMYNLTPDYNSRLSYSDCMVRCWNDCHCLAFHFREDAVGCIIWSGNKSTKFSPNPYSTEKYVLFPLSKGYSMTKEMVDQATTVDLDTDGDDRIGFRQVFR